MRFLADQDVWASTLRRVQDWGHDVVSASEIGKARAEDAQLLREAEGRNRILITRDHDFGRLVVAGESSAGVLFLRITPSTQTVVHEEMSRVLEMHSQSDLEQAFVVVEPGRYRIRPLE